MAFRNSIIHRSVRHIKKAFKPPKQPKEVVRQATGSMRETKRSSAKLWSYGVGGTAIAGAGGFAGYKAGNRRSRKREERIFAIGFAMGKSSNPKNY